MNCGRRIFLTSWAMCLLFVAAASAARAGSDDARPQHPIDRAVAACRERAGNTAEMEECEDKALKLWEQELNRVYRALCAKLTPIERRALEKSQRAWIQFRDSECAFAEEFSISRGTIGFVEYVGTRPELTRTRALALLGTLDELTH